MPFIFPSLVLLQYPEGIDSSSDTTEPHPHSIWLIVDVALRLRGGGYPQHILNKATELNSEEVIETKFYLYDRF